MNSVNPVQKPLPGDEKENPLPELIFLAAGFLKTICAPSLLQLALLVESYARHPGADAPVPVDVESG